MITGGSYDDDMLTITYDGDYYALRGELGIVGAYFLTDAKGGYILCCDMLGVILAGLFSRLYVILYIGALMTSGRAYS